MSGERNVDSRIKVQLEEDGGSNTVSWWMETSGLCLCGLMFNWSDKA